MDTTHTAPEPKAQELRVIGLIGGMSWESSAQYYQLINQAVRARLGPLRSARLLLYSLDFGPLQQAQHAGHWDEATALLADAAQRLHRGGADCIVLCSNTMHKVASHIAQATPIPLLHIADPIGLAAQRQGLRVLGLLGTRFTMEQDFLRAYLQQHYGLHILVPEAPARADMHAIIYDELCAGVVQPASRQRCQQMVADMATRGAQAVVLGCTEIGLLLRPQDSPLPLLDSTPLHALAAVDFALQGCAGGRAVTG